MSALLQPVQSMFGAFSNKTKDKIDMILEPLQAMLQMALLSISPVGTKLQIQENILYLQSPTITQPITRWYNSDKKDDLYFLYSVIKRFIKWYNPTLNKKSPMTIELYQLITTMSMEGFTNLFKTYSSSDSNTVIHVIQMYKNLLEFNNDKILMDEFLVDIEKNKVNIDEVFEKVTLVYDEHIMTILYHTLVLIKGESNASTQGLLIDGMMLLLTKYHYAIKEWIKINLVI